MLRLNVTHWEHVLHGGRWWGRDMLAVVVVVAAAVVVMLMLPTDPDVGLEVRALLR